MKPTEILSREHRVIELVLSCLERMAGQAGRDGLLDREAVEQAIDFIRTFADECHHGKEETHLFTAMVAKGVPKEGGPIGQMLREHEQGRAFVRAMATHLPGAAEGKRRALEEFARSAAAYVQLLRAHIQKEDGILFPMADRFLNEEDQQQLLRSFEREESEHRGEGTHEKYVDLAANLARRYHIPVSEAVIGSRRNGD